MRLRLFSPASTPRVSWACGTGPLLASWSNALAQMSAVVSLKVEDFFRFVVVVDSDRSNASHRSDSQRLNVIGSLKFRIAELPIVGPATLIEMGEVR